MIKVLIAIMFMLNGNAYSKEVLLDRIVAVVNADIITLSDLKEFERSLHFRKAKLSDEDYQKLAGSEKAMLDKIIESKIILQYLKDNNMVSDREELDSLIKRRMKSVGMTQKDLEKELKDSGQTMDDLRNELEVEQGKARIFDKDLKRKISISEQDYANFFEKEFNQDINISEYKIRHILVKDPKLAEKVYQEAKNGDSFDQLAYKYSEDIATKNNGGDLDYVRSDQMMPEMQKVVFNMSAGDIKGPIKTKLGYHIIKLDAFRTQKNPEYIKNKEMIERALVEKDFQRQLALWIDEKKEEYYVRTYL
jgi:parvulin-like peptidyl-prolyl isomerase